MLHLLHKNKHKILRWLPYIAVSTVAHLIVMILFLCVYQGGALHIDIFNMPHVPDVPIIIAPLYKRMHTKPIAIPKKKGGTSVAKQTASVEKAAEKPVAASVKKAEKAPTSLVPTKKKAAKTQHVAKKEAAPKQATAPVVEKAKPAVPEKIVEKEKPVVAEKEVTPAPELKGEQTAATDENGIDALVVGRDEFAQLEMQQFIQQEMSNHWRPPVGCRKDICCEITITVDWQGAITATKVAKSSGVPMYDTSARQAVRHMVPPKWLYGKELTIAFKQ